MTAAFVLAINMSIAGIFAAAFAAVAATNRAVRGLGWLAMGYGMGIVVILLEFALPGQANPLALSIGIFLSFLLAQTFCAVGVARYYGVPQPNRTIAAICLGSLIATLFIFSLPYGTLLRGVLYQLPYVAAQSLIGYVILRSGRRGAINMLLIALNGVAALTFLAKPLIAWMVGTASTPQTYMTSTYAAISQSIATVTLVALALVLLLAIMRDTTAEMMARAETDALSEVLNRRGFEAHGERMLAQAQREGGSLVLVTADIDHFKAINDGFGHAVGDEVIARFAALLREHTAKDAIVSRVGGEEFAVLLAGGNLADGRRYAEDVRAIFSEEPLAELGVDRTLTASFGVAQMMAGDSLADLSRRADAALYRAKAGGRNRVSLALGDPLPLPPRPGKTRRPAAAVTGYPRPAAERVRRVATLEDSEL